MHSQHPTHAEYYDTAVHSVTKCVLKHVPCSVYVFLVLTL